MNEVKITYETLFDLLRREKDREELQELDETFYDDVIKYLEQKHSFLKEDSSDSGLFGASESEKTKVQILNIKKIIKELYDRRLSKIIRIAVNSSKVNSSFMNTVAMLPEEQKFFEQLLSTFKLNRKLILDNILLFRNGVEFSRMGKPDASSALGESQSTSNGEEIEKEDSSSQVKDSSLKKDDTSLSEDDISDNEVKEQEVPVKDEYDIKVKVRFKGSVPKFVGKKMEIYGPYEEGDTAELPKIIANILLNKGRAEEME